MNGELLKKGSGILEIFGADPSEFAGDICTDTRKIEKGQAYLALNGENHRGIRFVEQALEIGSPLIVTECESEKETNWLKNLRKSFPQSSFIVVKDTTKYLQRVSQLWLERWREGDPKRFLIALTGSNGKTTTKEMLRFLLKDILPGEILATEGNLNNQFGVPLTLLRLNEEVEVGVIEMGTNYPGEIELLAEIAQPEAGLITNIGPAHLEFLGNLEGVFNEKASLYKVFAKGNNKKSFVVNGSDPYASRLGAFGDVTVLQETSEKDLNENQFSCDRESLWINLRGDTYFVNNAHLQGKHNWENLSLALLLLSKLFPGREENLIKSAQSLTLPNMNRGSWKQIGESEVFMDAYNANPASMKASFSGFLDKVGSLEKSSFLIIVGDMNELGERSSQHHKEVAEWMEKKLREKNIKNVEALFIGKYASDYRSAWLGEAKEFSCVEDFEKHFSYQKLSWDYIFLKGSRSLQLESIADIFERRLSN